MNQYTIFSIGDSAVTMEFGNYINEELNLKVIAMQYWLNKHPFDGLKDVIVAYSSLSVIYDGFIVRIRYKPPRTVFEFITEKLAEAYESSFIIERDKIVKRIPVCYDASFGYDLAFIANDKQISIEEVIQLHTSTIYRVYMLGFLPGFPYMATVDEKITISRKEKPRNFVAAGSVGIAGGQTGIYSLNSPGGWQIIGRTPLKVFDKNRPDKLIIKAGDKVKFYAVTIKEFARLSDSKS